MGLESLMMSIVVDRMGQFTFNLAGMVQYTSNLAGMTIMRITYELNPENYLVVDLI